MTQDAKFSKLIKFKEEDDPLKFVSSTKLDLLLLGTVRLIRPLLGPRFVKTFICSHFLLSLVS